MQKTYHLLQDYDKILNSHMENDRYLGTGDNGELVFRGNTTKPYHIILKDMVNFYQKKYLIFR